MENIPESVGGSNDEPRRTLTPYVSFKTFLSLIERLDAGGVPGRFDASYFTQYSGAVKSQLKVALRALGLMDEADCATDTLKQLIGAEGDERAIKMRQIFVDHYADALALPENATSLQLAEVFRSRGITGDTVHKATAFFLSMASYVDESVSPFFKQRRPRPSNKGGSRTRARAARQSVVEMPMDPSTEPSVKLDSLPHASFDVDPKDRYVNFLMDLAEKRGVDDSSDILDRIERVLGVNPTDNPS